MSKPSAKRSARLMAAGGLSLGLHLAMVVAVVSLRPPPAPPVDAPPVVLASLAPPPPPALRPRFAPAAAIAPPATPTRTPTPKPARARGRPAGSHRVVEEASEAASGAGDEPGAAEVGGAAVAGQGSGAGECDMAARVQAALRKDPLVHAALTASAHRVVRVWNGDWVASPGEDGRGLAAVREAIQWEVGFAPAACRGQAMRGLVLLSLEAPAGGARLLLGTGAWRWSDLLGLARAGSADRPGD